MARPLPRLPVRGAALAPGRIPDRAEAVDSPQELSRDLVRARQVLELVPLAPTLTWGRDDLHTGDMWNSNSLISWLLARSRHDTGKIRAPAHGRAPGWHAGLVLAARQELMGHLEPAEQAILTARGDHQG